MPQITKAVLIIGYCTVIYQFISTILMDDIEEVIEIKYVFRTPGADKKLQRELKKYGRNYSTLTLNWKPPIRFPTDLRFILKYTSYFTRATDKMFASGQESFIEHNCSYTNCFFTNNDNLLLDTRNFDAILFDAEYSWDPHPILRSPHQKYIFSASESAGYFPICDSFFDSYYNWTWTYRLDSDIRWAYVIVVDKKGDVVGPKVNMTWKNNMEQIPARVKEKLAKKQKIAAWFVSNCNAVSGREKVARLLNEALGFYGLGIDIYGDCGNLTCPRENLDDCLVVLEEEYYFYLAFENSICTDYVTEKILYPLQHYTVPIVYGGADYSRFLPPNSYINAFDMKVEDVASLMIKAMKHKDNYYGYFKWHNYYEFKEPPQTAEVCTLCRMLNENQSYSLVKDFRRWWNPKEKCEHKKQNN